MLLNKKLQAEPRKRSSDDRLFQFSLSDRLRCSASEECYATRVVRSKVFDKPGFSLVELLVVMVIIAMLAGLAAAGVKGYLVSARKYAARIEIANICKAVDAFYAEQGRYPSNAEGLGVLVLPTENFPTGFLNKLPKDPWKKPYVYRTPGVKGSYDILSLGSDGKEGGTQEAADIRNETSG